MWFSSDHMVVVTVVTTTGFCLVTEAFRDGVECGRKEEAVRTRRVEEELAAVGTDTALVLVTHLRVTRIRAYRASAHTQGPIGWEPQGVVPYDRAGPPGAIYSSNRGLLEHPPTVPREKRDWKAAYPVSIGMIRENVAAGRHHA